jgi:hypothetical protein
MERRNMLKDERVRKTVIDILRKIDEDYQSEKAIFFVPMPTGSQPTMAM